MQDHAMGAVTQAPPGSPADGFARYLDSLVGSWEAVAVAHRGATVTGGEGFVAALFPTAPVFNNALLLSAAALPQVLDVFEGTASYAVWSAGPSVGSSPGSSPGSPPGPPHGPAAGSPPGRSAGTDVIRALEGAGMRRDVTTTPMVLDLGVLDELVSAAPALTAGPPVGVRPVSPPVGVRPVSPRVAAALNGVGDELLDGVPGLLAYATADESSGLVLIPVGTDVNVSFVATRPDRRRQGLASLVLRFALADALDRGFVSASLQATPMAQPLYASAGFERVGRWQEWVPAAG